jgi:ABC-type transporter Mla subunit MlaD
LGFVVVFRVEADAFVETEAFLEETLEDIETFLDDTEALMEETFDETDAFLDETLDETEDFWEPLGAVEGLDETVALVEEVLTDMFEETEAFLEDTLADTELCLEETEAFLEEILDDTDAFLDDTLEGLGTTLEETDMAELDFDATTEGVIAELIIKVAIEWLDVDDTVMVWFMPALFSISIEIDREMMTTYVEALTGGPAALPWSSVLGAASGAAWARTARIGRSRVAACMLVRY